MYIKAWSSTFSQTWESLAWCQAKACLQLEISVLLWRKPNLTLYGLFLRTFRTCNITQQNEKYTLTILQCFYFGMVQYGISIPRIQIRKYSLSLPTLVWWEQPQFWRRIGWSNFPEGIVCLQIMDHLKIILDPKSDLQCNASGSHILTTHTLFSPNMKNQSLLRVKVDHLISHAPSPRSCHAGWNHSEMNISKLMEVILVKYTFGKIKFSKIWNCSVGTGKWF